MIKFFRNIRQNLIMGNSNTGKYFKYAIGEIILVVIGILIALQINNWNEYRKANIEENAILKSLYENLKLAKQQSEDLIIDERELKQNLISMLVINSDTIEIKKSKVPDSIFKKAVWDLQSDLPIVNAYFNLKNTNKLSLISNKNINEKFTNFEFRLNKLNAGLEDRLSVHQIRIDDILEKDINFVLLVKSSIPNLNTENEIADNYGKILNNKRIRNLLAMKLDLTQDVINYRLALDKEIEDLISLIDADIN